MTGCHKLSGSHCIDFVGLGSVSDRKTIMPVGLGLGLVSSLLDLGLDRNIFSECLVKLELQ